MKSVLLSVRPQHVANILNGIKTLEIRKRFPKDYVGWVYIYATKQGILAKIKNVWRYIKGKNYNPYFGYQGKVVARFWCDKVEEISFYQHKAFFNDGYEKKPTIVWQDYHTKSYACGLLEEPSCLTYEELHDYLKGKNGYAIHITKLDIFDKPKEIKKFYKVGYREEFCNLLECEEKYSGVFCEKDYKQLDLKYQFTRAPQSWCYIEV